MRMPRYISPTSLSIFYDARDKYYIQYLAETKTAREPQTDAMSVGSAFDAYVKSFLVERLIGKQPEFEFETIFEAQVEPHMRDFARGAGEIVFDAYKRQGALADILLDLEGAVGKPRFETAIEGYVTAVSINPNGVPLLGKPDIFFLTKKGATVIFDWKVNGFCSNYNKSPSPGYIRIRTNDPKTTGKQHPKAMVMAHEGMKIAANYQLDMVDKSWAAQLSIYAWLLGCPIGSKFIVAIDQIACGRDATTNNRDLRIAQHRSLVGEAFQKEVFERAANMWQIIKSGHIFDWMSREASDARCKMLDAMTEQPRDEAFEELLR